MKNYFNKFTNDNRIFSYQDVLNMSNEDGAFFKDAIDYQARTIGLPTDEQLQKSSDIIYVHAYTRDDGTKVRAHYRSKAGHTFSNPDKPSIQTTKDAKDHIENWAHKVMEDDGQMTGAAANHKEPLPKSFGTNLQKNFSKMRALEFLYEPNKPLSKEYYNISTTKGESIEKGNNTNNLKINVGYIEKSNKPLYEHIKNIKGNRPITDNDMVIIPKSNSPMTQAVKNSHEMKSKIAQNYDAIKKGTIKNKSILNVDFSRENDLSTAIGHAHVYDAYIDSKGNLNAYVVDWYDFDKMPVDWSKTSIINNNAYIQQENNDLANYALVIKVQYSPEEQKVLFGK